MRLRVVNTAVVVIRVSGRISAKHLSLDRGELTMLQLEEHWVVSPCELLEVLQHVYHN